MSYSTRMTPETLHALASLDVPQRETVLRVAELELMYHANKYRPGTFGAMDRPYPNDILCDLILKIIEGRQREQSRAGFGTPDYDRAAALLRSLDAQAGVTDNQGSLAGKRGE